MFSDHNNQYSHHKRQRLSGNISFTPLSDINVNRKNFLLEINGNSECNTNKDLKKDKLVEMSRKKDKLV